MLSVIDNAQAATPQQMASMAGYATQLADYEGLVVNAIEIIRAMGERWSMTTAMSSTARKRATRWIGSATDSTTNGSPFRTPAALTRREPPRPSATTES